MSLDGEIFESRHDDDGAATSPSRTDTGWSEADRQLRRLAARRCALDAAEAHWLREARRAQVHRHLGLGSFAEYLERTLGYAPRTAMERMRVAEALAGLPTTTAALARGRVAYSAVRELTRVATAETEEAWLAGVAGKTAREVEALVSGHRRGDRPESPVDPDLKPRHLRLALSPDVYARYLAARRQLEHETGERLSDDDVMAALCDAALASETPERPRHEIAVTVCERCDRGWQDAGGQVIEVEASAIEAARCDARQIGRTDGDAPEPVTIDIPAAVRRQVVRRDHGRCVVPGCRASRYVHLHHLVPRARGGAHVAANLCVLCTAHHRAVHDGRLHIDGAAPVLRFEHGDGRPYGTPPKDDTDHDHAADTRQALRTLGYSAREADAAVHEAGAHVSALDSLDLWIPAALRACAADRAST